MSLNTGAMKLRLAIKTLRARWDETQPFWSDQVRVDFEKNHLSLLEEQVRSTLGEIENLAEVIDTAKRECS